MRNLTAIFIISLVLNFATSFVAPDYSYKDKEILLLKEALYEKEDDMCNLQDSILNLQADVDSLSSYSTFFEAFQKYQVRKNLFKSTRLYAKYPGLNVRVTKYIKNEYISRKMYLALSQLTFPDTITVTSAKRHWSIKSHHYKGDAIDIRLNESGMAFASWLLTEEGELWREQNKIRFKIEDPSGKVFKLFKDKRFKKHFFKNRYATGKHLHLAVVA